MIVPNGNDFTTNTSTMTDDRWRIQTGNDTSFAIYLSTATSLSITGSALTDYDNSNTSYVYRRPSAVRKPKKKKGDLQGVNDTSKRLKMLPPVVVFKFVKKRFNMIEQKLLSTRFERISQLLETANMCNQIALKDKINEKFGQMLKEQEMIVCGFTQFIEKYDLQMFIDSCSKKVIKLTKLKNYIRIIPKNVRIKLQKAQKANMFDEYLVLHTDPDDKSVEKTAAEKKDPILFGVISESTRYYVIGDWEDEFCDITMDKIIDALNLEDSETTLNEDVESALITTLL